MSSRVGTLPGVPLSLWVPVSPSHPLSVNVWLCGSSLSPCSFIFLSPSGFLFFFLLPLIPSPLLCSLSVLQPWSLVAHILTGHNIQLKIIVLENVLCSVF